MQLESTAHVKGVSYAVTMPGLYLDRAGRRCGTLYLRSERSQKRSKRESLLE